MASFAPVRALLRGLEVLRVVSEDGPLTATDLSRALDLPQPTVIRLLETLIAAGYVYRVAGASTFGVTARALSLGSGYDADTRRIELARPLVEELTAEVGWPTSLAVYIEAEAAMSIAYTNRSAYGLSMPGRLGARVPLLVTAAGIVYLAHREEEECAAILERLDQSRSAWDTDPTYREGLEQRLDAVRRDGYGLSAQAYLDAVYDSRLWAVAVPIVVAGRVDAALATMVLQPAGEPKRLLNGILPPLNRTAAAIGRRLEADAAGLANSTDDGGD